MRSDDRVHDNNINDDRHDVSKRDSDNDLNVRMKYWITSFYFSSRYSNTQHMKHQKGKRV